MPQVIQSWRRLGLFSRFWNLIQYKSQRWNTAVVNTIDSEVRCPGIKFQPFHFTAASTRALQASQGSLILPFLEWEEYCYCIGFLCCITNNHKCSGLKPRRFIILQCRWLRNLGVAWLGLRPGLPEAEVRCQLGWAPVQSSGPLVLTRGGWQNYFLAVVGLKSCFMDGHALRPVLSCWRPPRSWPHGFLPASLNMAAYTSKASRRSSQTSRPSFKGIAW